MISDKNKALNLKVSNEVYAFLYTFSKTYHVSISSLSQHLINVGIGKIDDNQAENENFYPELAKFIRKNYDLRRLKK